MAATGDSAQDRLLREILSAQADQTARLASIGEMLEEVLRRLAPGDTGEPG